LQNQNNIIDNSKNGYSIKGVKLSSSPSPDEIIPLNIKPEDIEDAKDYKDSTHTNQDNIPKISFEDVPDTHLKVIKGSVSVIYWNSYKTRISKYNKITSSDIDNEKRVNELLNKYNTISVSDMSAGLDESTINQHEEQASKFYNAEIPSQYSLQTYTFSSEKDTFKISEELRKIPSVRTAYPTPEVQPLAITATKIGYKASNPLPPSDEFFQSKSEKDWWWFNKHSIFRAWQVFGTTTLPKIAVVDSGFDNSVNALDKPIYSGGLSVMYDPSLSSPWILNSDILEQDEVFPAPSTQQTLSEGYYSHGTMVASIIGSPKNGTGIGSGISGVLPGATIIPYRIRNKHLNSTAHAIFQASYSDADVINLSLGISDRPASYIPTIRAEIAGAISRNKIVVIASGNGGENNDPSFNCGNPVNTDIIYNSSCNPVNLTTSTFPDSGEIIVGGSSNDTLTNKTHAWSGSTFGGRVHLTAGADLISAPTFIPDTSSGSSRDLRTDSGTSFSTPMVSSVAGMMKKMNSSLNQLQIKSLLSFSSNLGRYNSGYTLGNETRFLGADPSRDPNSSLDNTDSSISIRDLNAYNALILAKNVSNTNYKVITRLFNIDDYEQATDSGNWANYYASESTGLDSFYGIGGLVSGNKLNFRVYNLSGGLTVGYQVYRNKLYSSEYTAGITGIIGAYNNSIFSVGANAGWNYTY
jgi:hypothetical protein